MKLLIFSFPHLVQIANLSPIVLRVRGGRGGAYGLSYSGGGGGGGREVRAVQVGDKAQR